MSMVSADAAAAPALPQGAVPWQGPFETEMYTCGTDIAHALSPAFGPMEVKSWRMPGTASWSDVLRHYDSTLSGWRRLPLTTHGSASCKLQAWSKGDEKFAIGVLDQPIVAGGETSRVLWTVQPDR